MFIRDFTVQRHPKNEKYILKRQQLGKGIDLLLFKQPYALHIICFSLQERPKWNVCVCVCYYEESASKLQMGKVHVVSRKEATISYVYMGITRTTSISHNKRNQSTHKQENLSTRRREYTKFNRIRLQFIRPPNVKGEQLMDWMKSLNIGAINHNL